MCESNEGVVKPYARYPKQILDLCAIIRSRSMFENAECTSELQHCVLRLVSMLGGCTANVRVVLLVRKSGYQGSKLTRSCSASFP